MSDLAHGMAHGGGRRGSIWKNLLKKKEGKGRQRYDREEESESECEERHQRFGREEQFSNLSYTEQEEWRDGLMAKGADIALVTYTRW